MTTKTKIEAAAEAVPAPEPTPAPIAPAKSGWGPTHKLVAALGAGFLALQAIGLIANHAEAKPAPEPAKPAAHKAHHAKHAAPKPEAKPAPIVVEVRCPATKGEPAPMVVAQAEEAPY